MAENVRPEKLTLKQQRAVSALMTGGTVRNAARISGVSERQIYRWLGCAAFQSALKTANESAIEAAVRMLSDASGIAVLTLRDIAGNTRAAHNARVRASDVILGHLMKMKEIAELAERVARLEQTAKERS